MEQKTKEFIFSQLEEQQKVLNQYQDKPDSPEYKAAMKAFMNLTAELRKDKDMELKEIASNFEREMKKQAEQHRIEMEHKEFELKQNAEQHRIEVENREIELKELETDSRIRIQEEDQKLKAEEQKTKLRDQGALEVVRWCLKMATLIGLYRVESAGILIGIDKLNAERKL